MYSSKEDLLTKAKTLLQDEMTSISYNTWIKTLEIDSINDNKITLIANSKMQKDAIESRLFDLVVNTFNFITNKTCEIKIVEKSDIIKEEERVNHPYRNKNNLRCITENPFMLNEMVMDSDSDYKKVYYTRSKR